MAQRSASQSHTERQNHGMEYIKSTERAIYRARDGLPARRWAADSHGPLYQTVINHRLPVAR